MKCTNINVFLNDSAGLARQDATSARSDIETQDCEKLSSMLLLEQIASVAPCRSSPADLHITIN